MGTRLQESRRHGAHPALNPDQKKFSSGRKPEGKARAGAGDRVDRRRERCGPDSTPGSIRDRVTVNTERMTAAVLYGKRDVRVEQVPIPRVNAGEVLVRVRAALTCGTDLK